MYITILILAAVTLVRSHDVAVGTNTSRKIFDENRHASPAIWKQINNVTISAEDNDVITGIFVTDQRPEKDGDVKIIEGGKGQKNVTLELKSPTVLRGYDFHIEVYTAPENPANVDENTQQSDSHPVENKPQSNADANKQPSLIPPGTILKDTVKPESSTTKDTPRPMSGDTKVNDNVNKAENGAENINKDLKTNNPLSGNGALSKPAKSEENDQSRHTRDVENQKVTKGISTVPIATNDKKSDEKHETKALENSSQKPSTIPREFILSDSGLKMNPISNIDQHNDTENKDDSIGLIKAEGIVPPTSLANDKKPSSSHNGKRQSRDTTHVDNTKSVDNDTVNTRNGATHPSSFNTEVKTNDASTEKSFTTPKVNAGEFPNTKQNPKTESSIKFPSIQPLLYTRTTRMVSTTEKIQKRDTESKTSTEKDSEENKFINVPKLIGAQNSTTIEHKPVISIQ